MTTPNTPQELFNLIYQDKQITKNVSDYSRAKEILETIKDRRFNVRELMEIILGITYILVHHGEHFRATGKNNNVLITEVYGSETIKAAVGIRTWVNTLFRFMNQERI